MRSTVPTWERSTTNSFTIVTASRIAPVSQIVRLARRVAANIVASASAVQKIDSAVCTKVDPAMVSRSNGTPAQ